MRPTTLLAICRPSASSGLASPVLAQGQDPRKDAAAATKAANDRLLDELPFSDRSDLENAKRG